MSPPSRICIESGKGALIEDMHKPLLPQICDNLVTDFFGFVTVSCYVFIKEKGEEAPHSTTTTSSSTAIRTKSSFLSLLNTKGEAKFGVEITLSARCEGAGASASSFFVSSVDMYAAVSTSQPKQAVRLVKWIDAEKEEETGTGTATATATGEGNNNNSSGAGGLHSADDEDRASPPPETTRPRAASATSTPGSSATTPVSKQLEKISKIDLRKSGQPIRHGDTVVIECEGK